MIQFYTYIFFRFFSFISSVQFSHSVMSDSLRSHALQPTRLPYHQLPELAQTHVHQVGDANLILCCPLLLLPLIFPSFGVFSNESVLCIRWPKYQSFSFSISPSNEYLGLISFRIGWFDLLALQGTLKSLLTIAQFKSINSSALSLVYGPTLTSIRDYWKNYSFD